VLLEVILALVLFAAAAAVIGVGLHSSIASVDRLRLGAQAADLAVTAFSELQLGLRSVTDAPVDGSDTNAWTVEFIAQPWGGTEGSGGLTDVEVILRHQSGYVHRGRQVMRLQQEGGVSP
jgi:type II secretory pathway pseudopilin PulG